MKKIFGLVLVCKLFALSDFELHKIDKAHILGYSGDTITIGVADDAFNTQHQSLKDKFKKTIYPTDATGQQQTPNFQTSTHGSHVSGIAAGSRLDNSKPYGVAYKAKLEGAGIFPSNLHITTPKLYDYFKDATVINNSWGTHYYPFLDLKTSNSGLISCAHVNGRGANICQVPVKYIEQVDHVANDLYKLATERHILNVFSAGNEGMATPGLHASLPRYDESLRSWLAVGALDSSHISIGNDGQLIVDGQGLADFSNAFKGTTNFSLVAAGVEVNNVDSKDNFSYTKKSGTSMAAPLVSGTAALVKEKFPFMDGKQIADVLLSTANKNYKAPKFTVKQVNDGTHQPKFLIVYIDNHAPITESDIKKDLEDLYKGTQVSVNNQVKNYSDYVWDNRDKVQSGKLSGSMDGVVTMTKEELFGQGILDAEKALGGPSVLDANRLSDSDVKSYEKENQTAYYTVDTKGYDAEFSNDISQRKWEENTHLSSAAHKPTKLNNLNIGLNKEGDGILILSGQNSYEGATLVKKGELRLKGKIHSSAYVEESAKFSGGGQVGKDLHNKGTVRPGNEDLSDLTVNGAYTQEGDKSKLLLDFGNKKNSKLVAKSYDIKGGNLEYIPLAKYYTAYEPVKMDLGDMQKNLSNFKSVLVQNSYAFSFVLASDLLTINPALKPNAYEIPRTTLGNALRRLRTRRDLSPSYEQFFASLDSGHGVQKKLDKIEGAAYLNTLSNHNQSSLIQNNILFTLNPLNINNFAKNNTILLASLYLPRIFNDKEYFWYLTPSYRYYNDKDFSGSKTGVNISLGQQLQSDFLAYALSFSSAKFNFKDDSEMKSYNMDFLLNYNHDLDSIRILSGAGVGLGFNSVDRFVVEPINGHYKTLQGSVQVGATKDINLNHGLILNPIFYLTQALFYQEGFRENQAPFAKSYKSIRHYSLASSVGLNLAKRIETDEFEASFSTFAMFEKRIVGRVLKNQASFIDFPIHFIQRYRLKDNVFSLGLNSEFLTKSNVFWQFMLMNNFSKSAYELQIISSVGKRF